MRKQKFQIGDKVQISAEALTWVFDNADFYQLRGWLTMDSTYDTNVFLGLCAAMDVPIEGIIIDRGSEDDDNDYFYGVRINTPALDFKYYDKKHLRKLKSKRGGRLA